MVPAVVHSHLSPAHISMSVPVQANAEEQVRHMLVQFAQSQQLGDRGIVEAEDSMDDGSPIRLAVTIDTKQRSAHFDFTGTGPEVFANTNAPPAVTYSAIIYAMRCMVQEEIPLNQVLFSA